MSKFLTAVVIAAAVGAVLHERRKRKALERRAVFDDVMAGLKEYWGEV